VILFLNAPGVEFHQRSSRWGGKVNRSGYLVLPIFLATAANYLRVNHLESHIIDAAALRLGLDEVDGLIREYNPEVIVIEASTISIKQDSITAEWLRKRYGATIVFVGFHVSALPERSLKELPIDFVCIGEYEETLLEFSRQYFGKRNFRKVQGLGFRDDRGNPVINERRPLLDINKLPSPLYDELPLKNYYDPIVRNHPCISIRTMRGCPFKCIYCVAPQVIYDNRVRYRDPNLVVDEMEYLVSRKVREIFIDDETFTINKKHVHDICRNIQERKLKIEWSCFSRGDCVDENLLGEMKAAGCYLIRYGIESFDDAVLRRAKKGIKTSQIKTALELTHRMKIKTHATVMYGLPQETMQTMKNTLQFILETDPDYAQFTICTPYPGTEYYDWAVKENRLLTDDWDDFDGSCKMIVKSDDVTPKQVEQFVDYSYRTFYFRLRYIFKRLFRIRRRGEIYYLWKSGFNLLKQTVRSLF